MCRLESCRQPLRRPKKPWNVAPEPVVRIEHDSNKGQEPLIRIKSLLLRSYTNLDSGIKFLVLLPIKSSSLMFLKGSRGVRIKNSSLDALSDTGIKDRKSL